jgi:glycosyltransferase involved in cell wall biosynthesis
VDAEVRIAADSAWYPVETNLREISLPSNITVKSAGNYTGLRDLYAACHFVVVPMLPARFACGYAVIAEAMAMGKTVIATRTHYVSDFIKDEENGFLVDVGDVEGLRARITYLLDNPSVAARMGQLARREMEQNWSLPSYTGRLEAVAKAASGLFTTSR